MANMIFSLGNFQYDKARKTMSAQREKLGVIGTRFPATFSVVSGTGKIVDFAPVTPDHPAFDQDQWDGEQQVYAPVEPLATLNTAVIYLGGFA